MPRQPRLNLPGLYFHVIARGIERRNIFRGPSDYKDFLKRLGEGLAETGCRCFAWALMPNHLHLLLLSGVRGLASLMQPLLSGYAGRFNALYRRAGHLFQNRYKAILCEEDPYFLELVRYIGLNPARAGLVRTPQELACYPWTSHRAFVGGPSESWLETAEVLGHFGSRLPEARQGYERFVIDAWNQGHRDDLEGGGLVRSLGGIAGNLAQTGERQMFDARILGSGSFVEKILRQTDAFDQTRQELRRRWTPDALQRSIASLAGVEAAELITTDRRRPVASARAMLVYAAKEWLDLNGGAIGRWLGLSSSGVAQALRRGRRLAEKHNLLEFLKSE